MEKENQKANQKANAVIEEKLGYLRGRIDATRFVTNAITHKIWDSVPEGDEVKFIKPITIEGHLDQAIVDLTEANERLSRIAECLGEQLGDLKLEN